MSSSPAEHRTLDHKAAATFLSCLKGKRVRTSTPYPLVPAYKEDELLAAEGLLFLSQRRAGIFQTESSSSPTVQNKRYKCDMCDAAFPSFQALGGHKTLHRIKLPVAAAAAIVSSRPTAEQGSRRHQCSICNKCFPTGQALGGHKRKHYNRILDRSGGARNCLNYSSSSTGVVGGSFVLELTPPPPLLI